MRFLLTLFLMLYALSPLQAIVKAHLVVNAKTGAVLSSSNADKVTAPASLTKMMTMFLLLQALDRGEITFLHKIPISKFAARQAPTKLHVKAGQTITVRDAFLAILTRSANDVSEAFAEFMGKGNRHKFYRMMNSQAKKLGMHKTSFGNASGLPHPRNLTTARDMIRLGLALKRHFPHHFHFFKLKSFKYKGKTIRNHNNMLGNCKGVNGVKTGLTNKSGSIIVTSCVRGKHHVFGVVFGDRNWRQRNQRMGKLLDAAFDRLNGRSASQSKQKAVRLPDPPKLKKVPKIIKRKPSQPVSKKNTTPYLIAKLRPFYNKAQAKLYTLQLVKSYPHYMRNKIAALEHIRTQKGAVYRPKIMHFESTQGKNFCNLLRGVKQHCSLIEDRRKMAALNAASSKPAARQLRRVVHKKQAQKVRRKSAPKRAVKAKKVLKKAAARKKTKASINQKRAAKKRQQKKSTSKRKKAKVKKKSAPKRKKAKARHVKKNQQQSKAQRARAKKRATRG